MNISIWSIGFYIFFFFFYLDVIFILQDIKEWLDESENGCVYISFGSMVQIETFSSEILDAFYEMFQRIAPTKVLIKIAEPNLLPKKLPDNVKSSTWLPQIAVLRKIQNFQNLLCTFCKI